MNNQKPTDSFRLGPNGPQIGTLGIGTKAWGRKGWGYGDEYTDAHLGAAFKITPNAGITFYDTKFTAGNSGRSFWANTVRIDINERW